MSRPRPRPPCSSSTSASPAPSATTTQPSPSSTGVPDRPAGAPAATSMPPRPGPRLVGRADAIAVTGVARGPRGRAVRRRARRHRAGDGRRGPTYRSPTATRLRDVLQEWAIRHVQTEMPGYFDNARTVVLGGSNHDRTMRMLREYTATSSSPTRCCGSTCPATLDSVPAARAGRRSAACGPLHHLPGVRARRMQRARSARLQPRPGPQGGAGLRRRRRDLRRAGRLRSRGPRRQDPDDLGHLRRPARRAGRPRRRHGARHHPQPFDVTVSAAVLEAMMTRRVERLATRSPTTTCST